MISNNKTSHLIASQVPFFVRNDHPNFITFLEKYYEYLEQNSKVMNRTKNVLNYQNVDLTEDEFAERLYAIFMPLIPKDIADTAFEAATCIGCGACVSACKNASAMLFVGAKVTQLSELPQGQAERESRVVAMVNQMDAEGFGACSNTGACAAECPKEIPLSVIANLNREYYKAKLNGK